MSQPFWNPSQLRFARAALVAIVGMVLFGLIVTTVTYPSWQTGVATVCVAAIIPILWVGLRRRPAPLDPGTSATAHLASAVPAVAALGLFAIAGWLLSIAPIE